MNVSEMSGAAVAARTAYSPARTEAQRPAESGAPRCTVEEIREAAALERFAPEWDAFSERAGGALLFNTSAWVQAWWRRLAGRTHPGSAGLRVLVIRESGVLRAVAPLWLETRSALGWRYRIARFAAEGPSDYGDVLVAGAVEPVMRALAAHLAAMGCDALELREWFGSSPRRQPCVDALERAGWRVDLSADSVCRNIPPNTWDAYCAQHFTGKRKRDQAWAHRRLQQAGPVSEAYLSGVADVRAFAEGLAGVQADRSFADGPRPGEFNDPLFRPFIEEVLEQANARGWLRVATMGRDGRTIAYFLCFLYRGRYYVYNTAHRHGSRDSGAGRVLMLCLIRSMLEEGGGVIDYLRGAEAFKEALSDDVVENVRVHAACPGWRGRLAGWLVFSAVPTLERRGGRAARLAIVALNEGWRGLVRRVGRRRRARDR